MTYQEQLDQPEWKRKRTEIILRDNGVCRVCLQQRPNPDIHHLKYIWGKMAWDYPNELLIVVCRGCHEQVESLKKQFSLMMHDDLGVCMGKNFIALANGKQWSEFITVQIAFNKHPELLEETYQACVERLNLNPSAKDE